MEAAVAAVDQQKAQWLTLNEAAAVAKVSTATLRREIRARRLRHARVAGRRAIRIRAAWIDEWLEQATLPTEH